MNLLFCFSVFQLAGQPGMYNAVAVPEAVKLNASVIVNTEDIVLKVESLERATRTVHKIFTVLNEEGRDALLFNEYSSKIISLEDVEIKVFDAHGKLREKYKKRDMRTTSVGEGLIDDGYVTYCLISTASYPVTIEQAYEQKIKSTLLIPDYRFIHEAEGIVQSSYTVKMPTEIGLRYKAFNTTIKPTITADGAYIVYKWSVNDLPPIEHEEGSLSPGSRFPHISLVADNFSFYGVKGDLSSWKSFGSWINGLYKDLDVLPSNSQQFFLQLVKDAPTQTDKIRIIYRYLQENFRYVSIQLGIGGLKPFSAEFTGEKKYGDCKALSNFMKAALKTIGVNSYLAIINSDYNQLPVDPTFPCNEFNHVILCIPADHDSIWLECTSSTIDFGELGTFTENKNALLITEQGGVLVPTPKSRPAENLLSTYTVITMRDDLSAQSTTRFKLKGEYRERMSDLLKEKEDDQKSFLISSFGFRQPDEFELLKGSGYREDSSHLKMSFAALPEFNAGAKSFVSPRINKLWSRQLPTSDNRKFDYYFPFPFVKTDTSVLFLPAGIKPAVMLKAGELKCDYATYASKSWFDEAQNAIYSVATLTLTQYKIAVKDYASVKHFFDDLLQLESQKMVIKKE